MDREAEVSDVELRLRRLGSALRSELATRDVVPAVVDALAHDRDARSPRRVRRAVVAVGAAIVVSASAAWAATSVVFDGGAVTVHRGPGPASPPPEVRRPHLGERISLERARALPGFLQPHVSWLDTSPTAWVDAAVPDQLSLSYPPGRAQPGILIQTFAGDGREVIRKYLVTDSKSERVRIAGADAVFLHGGDHTLFYLRPDGRYATVPGRLVGNALILRHGRLTVRIEAQLPRRRLVELATSLGRADGR